MLPWVEIGIAGSVVVLGAAVALRLRPSLAISVPLVGVFALLHGYAHGAELPANASALTYAGGFVAATLVLHADRHRDRACRNRAAGALRRADRGGAIAAAGPRAAGAAALNASAFFCAPLSNVMAGLVPAIRCLRGKAELVNRGWPGQARP